MDGIVVIKCGGSMIDSLSKDFYEGIREMQNNGYKPIIVHGGGPAINQLLEDLSIESEFVNGLRKTTDDVMNVVEMVLSGTMTNKLVRQLQKHGITSIGITGSDGGLMYAKAKDLENLGLVGEITHVNQDLLFNLISIGLVPVISPIAMSSDSEDYYNINADTAAAAVAVAVKAEKLLFVTDVPGVFKDSKIIEQATTIEIMSLIDDGTISGGMIPKVMAAIHSLEGGMNEVMIVSGQTHLLDGSKINGTTIQREMEAVK
ncbi:acetylglutamate kinase [Lederbergia citrea]|uniref:acetylglutamate kinase n=1 Tax=Lederbergia citrea TaxID=2833581 RepID=UPI001BC98DAB|nr:acetylglutamate kinase [Lederbergia citrea]MBS4203475.1 acetylglutamate kinase [Lederbergia citrea]